MPEDNPNTLPSSDPPPGSDSGVTSSSTDTTDSIQGYTAPTSGMESDSTVTDTTTTTTTTEASDPPPGSGSGV
jgi:hypothetical protein